MLRSYLITSLRRSRPCSQWRPCFATSQPRFSTSQLTRNSASPLRQRFTPKPEPSESPEPQIPPYDGSSFAGMFSRPSVRNQIIFFAVGSTLIFGAAAWQTNRDTYSNMEKLRGQSSVWRVTVMSSPDLWRFKQAEFVQKIRNGLTSIIGPSAHAEDHTLLQNRLGALYVAVFQPIVDAGPSKRLCWSLVALNAVIWIGWKVGRLQPFMGRHFAHNPLSGRSYTMLTSVFSHVGIIHLFLNCYVLEGFGSATGNHFAREQRATGQQLESTAAYHLLAFLASAGMFASLVHHIASARFIYPRIIKRLTHTPQVARKPDTWAAAVQQVTSSAPSARTVASEIGSAVGMSGAIYACLVVTALAYPDAKVSLVIPPTHPFSIQWGLYGLLCLDFIGALRGWRVLGHWAHLGGAAFGAAYYYWGIPTWNWLRSKLTTKDLSGLPSR